MASKDVFSKELGSFFKAAQAAFEDVSEQVVASSKAGKATIDVQVLKRQREKALVRLGELVLTHVETGGTPPAGGEALIAEITGLDADLKTAQAEADKLFAIDPLAAARGAAQKAAQAAGVGSRPPEKSTERNTEKSAEKNTEKRQPKAGDEASTASPSDERTPH